MKKYLTYTLTFFLIAITAIVGSTVALKTVGSSEKTDSIIPTEVRTFLLPESEEEVTPLPTPEVGLPTTISIPAIQVNADIEYVGLDNQRRMDVPKDEWNVAWYELGPKPGELGNAAIAGHLDSTTGPAVFYNLEKLAAGDQITVTDAVGQIHTFKVTEIARYDVTEFPLEKVFGKHDTARLNLITCEGAFDSSTQNYSHRVVVYSEKIES